MEINKRNRSELKSYFIKNSIPTESNFAEFIDAMLNQKEDGIAKPSGNPLSIEAAGDDTSQKKTINFYRSFADQDPVWSLSLNPRSDPSDPKTARPGLSISDGAGNSRLFIDQATGNVGIGTTDRITSKLYVRGRRLNVHSSQALFAGILDEDRRVQVVLSSGYSDLVIASSQVNDNHGSTLTFATYNPADVNDYRKWVINQGNWGRRKSFLDFGYADVTSQTNPHGNISARHTVLTLDGVNKRVGIGTTNPGAKLEVKGGTSILEQQAWQTPSLQNGWLDYSNIVYNSAGYFKDSMGVVHLRGLVKNGTFSANRAIFTLPAGYRPPKREIHVVGTSPNVSGRADIQTDGQVRAVAGSEVWFSLDGITFRAA